MPDADGGDENDDLFTDIYLSDEYQPSTSKSTIEYVIVEAISGIYEADVEPAIAWGNVTGDNLKDLPISEGNPDLSQTVINTLSEKTPYDFFRYFLNDDVLQLIV